MTMPAPLSGRCCNSYWLAGKIKNGTTRQQVHHLAGNPVLSDPKQNREQYYSGVSTVTIEYEGDNVINSKFARRKKYQ